ncbi:MAG: hypothetical protein EXR51_00385 [Dehalococcoidia bacterium]|nr:hypothetical protein [Dehalococcoidia bacterium]
MAKLYFEDVQVGDRVPEFRRQTGYMEWGRFAGANEEYVAIHEDDDAGTKSGLPGGIGMGNLRFCYVQNMLNDWMGEDGWIKKVSLQYRGLNLKNDWIITKGTVTGKQKQDGECLVELDVQAENGKGEVTAPGKAVVLLPCRG